MSSAPAKRITAAEYLAAERLSETKHEFFDGQVYAMSGASRSHNRICVNLITELVNRLKGGPCEPFGMDMRVKVDANGLYTYPDIIVVCGEALFEDDVLDTLLNPKIVIEVLSASTESYDRGRKFALYSDLEGLGDYILVAQDAVRVEHLTRLDKDNWHLTVYSKIEDVLLLPSVGCEIPLREIYGRVELPDTPLWKSPASGQSA